MDEFFSKIYGILVSFLGESKKGYCKGIYQYQFSCPRCIDNYGERERGKFNLEVNILKMRFQCWKCSSTDSEMHGSVSKLIRLYGNADLYKEYCDSIMAIKGSKLYELHLKNGVSLLPEDALFDTSLSLPDMYKPFKEGKYNPKKALSYLNERGIGWDIINKYNIGYTEFDINKKEMSTRIILPSHDEYGNINYWTGRDYSGYKGKQKYFNPKVERKDIIFDEDKIQWDADITLVEGPFDHIVVPNSIPLLGKSLKKDFALYDKLMSKANANVNIFLDGDAKKDVIPIYKLLNQGRLHDKIRWVRVDKDLDPSEIYQKWGYKGIVAHLRNTEKINEVYLI